MWRLVLAFALASLTVRPSPGRPDGGDVGPRAQAVSAEDVLAEFDRLTEVSLWPGFEPRSIPLAIYDGSVTWLIRHPDPPASFRRRDLESDLWFVMGQHEAVRANSHATIGDTLAATLIIDAAAGHAARELAGILIHEAFHVYQAGAHRDWFANELELLSYPWEVPELIALRRLEGESLRLALSTSRTGEATCWARRALRFRRSRYAGMPAASAEYEWRLELAEGLATYVEGQAVGSPDEGIMDGQPFAADAVRQRAYASGNALAALLDVYAPGWKLGLERATGPLDQLLAAALPEPDDGSCGFSQAEMQRAEALAASDVAAALADRAAARSKYMSKPGWRLDVVSHGSPLWPSGFDPLNMQVLGGREVLHSRWLELSNSSGVLEVLDRAALTVGAGEHPLFEGVERMILTGLPVEPGFEQEDERLIIRGRGITAELTGARVEKSDRLIVIHLPAGS